MNRGVPYQTWDCPYSGQKISGRYTGQVCILTIIEPDNSPALVPQENQTLVTILESDWKLHCAYGPQSSGQMERLNRTLKETLTKLALEIDKNRVTLLPFTLYWGRNSLYQMGLTPFQITFGTPPPPIIPSLQSELLAGLDDQDVLDSIWWLQWTHKHIWPKLRALYESVAPHQTHRFQLEDWIFIWCHW